jgi:hypothetical protein
VAMASILSMDTEGGAIKAATALSSSQMVSLFFQLGGRPLTLVISGYIVRDPLLPFFSLIALLIGVLCGNRIRKSGFTNSR